MEVKKSHLVVLWKCRPCSNPVAISAWGHLVDRSWLRLNKCECTTMKSISVYRTNDSVKQKEDTYFLQGAKKI